MENLWTFKKKNETGMVREHRSFNRVTISYDVREYEAMKLVLLHLGSEQTQPCPRYRALH